MARYDTANQVRMRRVKVACEAWLGAGGSRVPVVVVPVDVVHNLLAQGAVIGARRHHARILAASCWMSRLNADGAS